MIKDFKCKETEKLFERKFIKRLPTDIHRVALRKLKMLDAATMLETLKVPPGNRLEVLRGDCRGKCSIRINDQWRICFVWHEGNAFESRDY
jgi:proteic killer suppression protein